MYHSIGCFGLKITKHAQNNIKIYVSWFARIYKLAQNVRAAWIILLCAVFVFTVFFEVFKSKVYYV